jgi:hypothetical protein
MAKCDLCGDSAGMFRNRHPSCEEKAVSLGKTLHDLVLNSAQAGLPFEQIYLEAEAKIRDGSLPISYFRRTMLSAANEAAMQISLNSPIPPSELDRLVNLLKGFGYPTTNREEIVGSKLWGMAYASMSNTLWAVHNDVTPYCDGNGRVKFNLHRGETPIIDAGNVTFAEERTISTGSRLYGGLSVPVGGGMYSHIGGSQTQRTSGLLPLDVGDMLITSQSLYFGGQKRTMRISLGHVLRYEPYVDGVGVCEPVGPPRVFVPGYSGMDTGWFFFNLLVSLTSKLSG